MVLKTRASRYRDRIRIERPVADTSLKGAGSGTWALVAIVACEVKDRLPSKGESESNGFDVSARPARVRMAYRTDVTAAMRFVMGSRIMQIVAGPADLGRREEIEFMVEEYSPAGNRA